GQGAHRARDEAGRGKLGMADPRRKLNVGLIGLGRLGRVYARDLATRIPETRLVAVADPDQAARMQVAEEHDVRGACPEAEELLDSPDVEAVVVAGPTHTHRPHVLAAAARRRPIFCEKPPALTLAETQEMKDAVGRAGVLF